MASKQVEIRSKINFQELIAQVKEGIEIVLTENDQPVARLTPIGGSGQPRILGLHEGSIWMSDDFDAPLPDEFWLGEDA